ncbi:hypothetical protein [Sphingomonas oligophenolica]|uniref:hypothetical protein n=1 Tax=Sphingomonas oligophenolica TaxID=301154 RepID=UPI0031F56AB7
MTGRHHDSHFIFAAPTPREPIRDAASVSEQIFMSKAEQSRRTRVAAMSNVSTLEPPTPCQGKEHRIRPSPGAAIDFRWRSSLSSMTIDSSAKASNG